MKELIEKNIREILVPKEYKICEWADENIPCCNKILKTKLYIYCKHCLPKFQRQWDCYKIEDEQYYQDFVKTNIEDRKKWLSMIEDPIYRKTMGSG